MANNELPHGLIETKGSGTARQAADRVIAAIEELDNIGLVAEVDHAAGAKRVGLELTPTIELLFGSPAGGTPLMHIAPTVGIDLPQKILIIQTETGVRVFYNDPAYLAERHGIPPETPQLAGAAKLLQNLAGVAIGTTETEF